MNSFEGSVYTAAMMKRLQPLVVPTEPGHYLDYAGHPWVLQDNGEWRDKTGATKPVEYNWMLVSIAPFYPVEAARV